MTPTIVILIIVIIVIIFIWSISNDEPRSYCSYCYKNDCIGAEEPICYEQIKDDAIDVWISTSGLMTSPNIETIVVYDFEYPKEVKSEKIDKYSIIIYVYKNEEYIDAKYLIEIISSKRPVNNWKQTNKDIEYSEYLPTKKELVNFVDLIRDEFQKDFDEEIFLDFKNRIEKEDFEINEFEQIEQILLMK